MKQKRSPKNKKPITKTTRKVARRSNPSGLKDPKGFATQSGGVTVSGGQTNAGMIAGGNIYSQAAPDPIVNAFHQLPSPPADFVGRDAELKTLREYVKQGGATICAARGLGGVGKTTLALKLAHDLKSDYPDAQFYLNLQGASNKPLSPSDVLAHIIRAYHPTAKLPDGEVEMRSIYLSVLDGKRALLLMDNAKDAAQVEPLIPPSSCLLLVTSRQKFVLPDIRTIDLDELSLDESRNLLNKIVETRHGASLPNDTATEIANLCGRLPLALRLAGSALAEHIDLEPAQYMKRLGDKKNRLQLIEASFSLSYDLLTKEQQKLWRMLAIFPSSFEVMGASAVWGIIRKDIALQRLYNADVQDKTLDKTQEALSDFVRYSILDYDTTTKRYNLHDLAKVFADSRLSEKEKYEAGLRHATHYLSVLQSTERLYLRGSENIAQSLKLFDSEVENISSGQTWASAKVKESHEVAEICNHYALQWNVLNLRLHPYVYISWAQSALVASQQLKDKLAEGSCLNNLGIAYANLGDVRKAIRFYKRAINVNIIIGNKREYANNLGNLGIAYKNLGEMQKAIKCQEQRLKIISEFGDEREEGVTLSALGNIYIILGEIPKGIELIEQALGLLHKSGDRRGESNALGNLGGAHLMLGETKIACEFSELQLAIAHEIGDSYEEGNALGNLGNAYSELGETLKAIEFYEQQLNITREISDRRGEGIALWNMALTFDELGERAKAIEYAEESLRVFVTVEDPRAKEMRKQLEEWRGDKH